ncbi:MAG TPA: cupin domain-containing protein [Pyrinomonadaceae bacterium]|nr:cupin domain-containing protein [Pyrinomonadaceae bacterium]
MAVILEGGCRVSDMREGEPVVNGCVRIWNQIGKATGAQEISLRVMEFAPGSSPTIRNDDCDQILYVVNEVRTACVSGRANVSVDDQSYEVAADTGIYLQPNRTFAIENPTSDAIVIISSLCPDPARDPLFVDGPEKSEDSRLTNPPLVRLIDQKAQSTADRWYRVLIDKRVGSEQVTQFVGSIPPGRALDHFHEYEEVLFILKGEGRMWAGQTNTPISVGSCIYLPKGQVHCVENMGAGELRLLGVFYPAGSPSVRYDA